MQKPRKSVPPPLPGALLRLALPAAAADFDDGAVGLEAGLLGGGADSAGEAIVVDMGGVAAIVADEEDAVVQAARMVVGDIGVGALDPAGDVGADEQVEDAIDAVGRDPAALHARDGVGDVVGGGRAV